MSEIEQSIDCQCRKLRRMFSPKELRLYILSLLTESSSYGYELIKKIEVTTSGFYCPSPGVIYPTLTLLEEQGLIEPVTGDKGRKLFSITEEGELFLAEYLGVLNCIKDKLKYAQELKEGNSFADEIESAVDKFKNLLRHKIVLQQLADEESIKIVNIINQAVQRIEAMNLALISEEQ